MTKIAHIVPSAFEYFDDIKKNAFETVERLNILGVECLITTLQYQETKKKDLKKIIGTKEKPGHAPSYKFKGIQNIDKAIASFDDYDIVHLHCPFLGAGGRILKWRKQNPNKPLIVTYYRRVELVDTFSFFIILYNKYYLSRILKLANIIAVFPETFKKTSFVGLEDKKIINITPGSDEEGEKRLTVDLTNYSNKVKLKKVIISEMSLFKLITLYSLLLEKKS